MLDTTNFKGEHVLICTGITESDVKHALGVAELPRENAAAASGLLEGLLMC